MNNVITKKQLPQILLVSYDYNTKIFIDFRTKERTNHKPSSGYLLLSNKIDKLYNRIKELSKN